MFDKERPITTFTIKRISSIHKSTSRHVKKEEKFSPVIFFHNDLVCRRSKLQVHSSPEPLDAIDNWISKMNEQTEEEIKNLTRKKNVCDINTTIIFLGILLLYLFSIVCSCLQEERQLIKEGIESYATEKVDCILQSLDADAQALTRQFQHLQKRRAKYSEACFSRVLESFLREAEVALLFLAL